MFHDLKLVEEQAATLGLQLNCSKSELFCRYTSVHLKVPGLYDVSGNDARLMGTPIGSIENISSTLQEKVEVNGCLNEISQSS